MALVKLYNLARMTSRTVGTSSPMVLVNAVDSFLTFDQAGVQNGDTITYAIEDGDNREIGRGVYTTVTKSLTRQALNSTNGGALIDLSGFAQVFITASNQDLPWLADTAGGISYTGTATVGSVSITSSLSVGGTAAFSSAVSVASSLTGGSAAFSNVTASSLSVSGAADVSGQLRSLSGAATSSPATGGAVFSGGIGLSGSLNMSGRIVNSNTSPVFDLAAGAMAVNALFCNSSAISVPAGNVFYFERKSLDSGSQIPILMGSSATAAGYASYLEMSSSAPATAALYSNINTVYNSGHGTTKGGYFRATALTGCDGVVVGGVSAINASTTQFSSATGGPVAGAAAWVHEYDYSSGPDDTGIMNMWQTSGGNRLLAGITSLTAINYLGPVFRAWMGSGSAAGARPFQLLSSSGAEYYYVNKDGGAFFSSAISISPGYIVASNNWSGVSASNIMADFDSYADAPRLIFRRANGVSSTPTAVAINDALGQVGFRGYHSGGAFTNTVSAIFVIAAENWTSTANGVNIQFQGTNTGSTTPALRMSFFSDGGIVVGDGVGFVGKNVLGVTNVSSAPSASAAGIGQLYCSSGYLFYRGTSGTVTMLATA